MFKLTAIAALVALLSACSSMPGSSMTGSSGMSRTTMGAPGSGTAMDPTGQGGMINAPN